MTPRAVGARESLGRVTLQGQSRGQSREALPVGGGWTPVRTSHRGTGLRSHAISLHLLWPFLGFCTPRKQSGFPSPQHKGFLSLRVALAGLHMQCAIRVWTHYSLRLLPVLLGGRVPEAKNGANGTAALASRSRRSRSSRRGVGPLRGAGRTDTRQTRLAGTEAPLTPAPRAFSVLLRRFEIFQIEVFRDQCYPTMSPKISLKLFKLYFLFLGFYSEI